MAEDPASAPRLPTHVEAGALLRRVQQEGGFATVIAKGEPEAGTLLVVLAENGRNQRAYERMPDPAGGRPWTLSRREDPDSPQEFSEWLSRRQSQDPDLWIIELDIPRAERFIPGVGDAG